MICIAKCIQNKKINILAPLAPTEVSTFQRQFAAKHKGWVQEKKKLKEGADRTETTSETTKLISSDKEGKTGSGSLEKVKGSFYATKQDVDRALHAQANFVLIIFQEALFATDELPSNLPPQVSAILQEFEDVFPEDLPQGLPPLRGIEH